MNNDITPENVLVCDKQIDPHVDRLLSGNSKLLAAGIVERQLIWSSLRPDHWEILVYKRTEGWEACFFRWPIHHEHVTGSSFEFVRQRAEKRIRVLEAGRLKSAEWPHRSVAATLQDETGAQSHLRESARCEPRPALRTPFVKSLMQSDEFENGR